MKISNDATSSTKGTVYQLCVAVQKCFEMLSGQKVLIEKEGDVTIENEQQVETKFYSDDLTDGHKNLWNTLKNWIQPHFDETAYSSLILFTTQQFGRAATIKDWNDCDLEKRVGLLTSIHAGFEDDYKKEQAKPGGKASPPTRLGAWAVPDHHLRYQKMLLLFLRIHRRPFAQPQFLGVDLVLDRRGHDG